MVDDYQQNDDNVCSNIDISKNIAYRLSSSRVTTSASDNGSELSYLYFQSMSGEEFEEEDMTTGWSWIINGLSASHRWSYL